jgi:uncharacterized protein with PIN domain
MCGDHSSPRKIVSQEAICVNGETLRCVQCDEPILDLQCCLVAESGDEEHKVHEQCAEQFDAARGHALYWYGPSAEELLNGSLSIAFWRGLDHVMSMRRRR